MTPVFSDEQGMAAAFEAAQEAARRQEAPIGAALFDAEGTLIAACGNAPIEGHDPTAHAEILVLRHACGQLGNYRLPAGTKLYVTLEPCAMCAGAIAHARVSELIIAASDPKGGAVWHGPKFFDQPTCHWRPQLRQGPMAKQSADLLRSFFRDRR